MLVAAIVLVMGAALVLGVRLAGALSLTTLSLAGIVLGFGVRALTLATRETTTTMGGISFTDRTAVEYTAMAAVGAVLVLAGSALASLVGHRGLRARPPGPPPGDRPGATGEHRVVRGPGVPASAALGAAGIAWVVQAALLAASFGGLGVAWNSLRQRTIATVSVGAATNVTFLIVPLVLYAVLRTARDGRSPRRVVALAALVALVPWAGVVNGRGTAVVVVFAYLLVRAHLGGGMRRSLVAVVAVVAVIAIAVGGLAFRRSAQNVTVAGDATQGVDVTSWAVTVSDSLPLYDHFAVGKAFAELRGHQAGFVLDSFVVLVPRSVFPGKPLYLAQQMGLAVGRNDLSGIPSGLAGEGYLIGGWPAVFGAFAVFGLLVGVGDTLLRRGFRADGLLGPWFVVVGAQLVLVGLRTGIQGGLIMAQVAVLYGLPLYALSLLFQARATVTVRLRARSGAPRAPVGRGGPVGLRAPVGPRAVPAGEVAG